MILTPSLLISTWLRKGELNPLVPELFNCLGVTLSTLRLHQANDELQDALEADLDLVEEDLNPDLLGEIMTLARELLLIDEMPSRDHDELDLIKQIAGEVDVLVVPGGTIQKMRHRLAFGHNHNLGVSQIVILASQKPLNKDDYKQISEKRMLPVNPTEADAAEFLMAMYTFLAENRMRSVIATPSLADGTPARTDETITTLVSLLDGEPTLSIALHQPSAPRMMMTFERLLKVSGYAGEVHYLSAGLLPDPGHKQFMPNLNFLKKLREESIRLVYELSENEILSRHE